MDADEASNFDKVFFFFIIIITPLKKRKEKKSVLFLNVAPYNKRELNTEVIDTIWCYFYFPLQMVYDYNRY